MIEGVVEIPDRRMSCFWALATPKKAPSLKLLEPDILISMLWLHYVDFVEVHRCRACSKFKKALLEACGESIFLKI